MVVAILVIMVVLLSAGAAFIKMGEAQRMAEGADRGSQMIQDKMETIRKLPYTLVGCYDDDPLCLVTAEVTEPENLSNGELMVNLGPTRPPVLAGGDSVGTVPVEEWVTIGDATSGNKYTVTTVVTWAELDDPLRTGKVDPPATNPVPPAVLDHTAKRVTVTATWQLGATTRSVTRDWLRSPTSAEVVPPTAGVESGSRCLFLRCLDRYQHERGETGPQHGDHHGARASSGQGGDQGRDWRLPMTSNHYELASLTSFANPSRTMVDIVTRTKGNSPEVAKNKLCVNVNTGELWRYTGVYFTENNIDEMDRTAPNTAPILHATGMSLSAPNQSFRLNRATDHPLTANLGSGYLNVPPNTLPGTLNNIKWSYAFQPGVVFKGQYSHHNHQRWAPRRRRAVTAVLAGVVLGGDRSGHVHGPEHCRCRLHFPTVARRSPSGSSPLSNPGRHPSRPIPAIADSGHLPAQGLIRSPGGTGAFTTGVRRAAGVTDGLC